MATIAGEDTTPQGTGVKENNLEAAALQSFRPIMIRRLLVASLMLQAIPLFGGPRITFIRTAPAPRTLAPAERLAVIYALSDTQKVLDFVQAFVDTVDRAGTLRLENAIEGNQYLTLDEPSLKRLRREHPAEGYLGIRRFSCHGKEQQAEGSERDRSGERVRRMHHWIDATCEARVDVMSAEGKRRFSYPVRGEGTSPRSAELSEDERDIAYAQAARYAAVAAAEEITPRVMRESIELDETAPDFEEAFGLIQAGRLADARMLWETAMASHPESAALRFDLAAVCEALEDVPAAGDHLQAAVLLAPKQRKFETGWNLFRRRNAMEKGPKE